MRCPRTREIDWAAYQADPTSDEWAEVRAHYPTCPDCSREVERLTRMRLVLAGSERPAHPSEEELLAYDRQPAALTATRQTEIERHVADCRRCRNELSVLEALMPVRVGATAASDAEAPDREGFLAWLIGLLTGGPALAALGTAALVVIGLVIALGRDEPTGTDAPEQVAIEEPAPTPDGITPESDEKRSPFLPDQAPSEVERLAERPPEPTPAPQAPDPLDRDPGAEPRPPAEQLAETPSAPPARESAPERATPTPVERPAEILIASLDLPLAAPRYDPSALLSGAALGDSRIDVMIRAGGVQDTLIRVLAPVHTAITFERSPTLYWHLSTPSDAAVELLIVDRETDEPVFEQTLAPPVREGLHALDLSSAGVALEPGRDHLFFASIVPDPDRRDLDLTAGIVLRAQPDAAPAAVPLAEQPSALARAGSWLDAFATLQRWIDEAPDLPRALAHRAALLEQVGRDEVARSLAGEAAR